MKSKRQRRLSARIKGILQEKRRLTKLKREVDETVLREQEELDKLDRLMGAIAAMDRPVNAAAAW